MVTTVRPKASDTPTIPMPTSGNAAARTALPQPPNTSQKVPNSSATARFARGMSALLMYCWPWKLAQRSAESRAQGRRGGQPPAGCRVPTGMALKQLVSLRALFACLSACGGGEAPPLRPPAPPPVAADPFAAVDAAAGAAFSTQGIAGMGVAVYDAQGVKRFEKMYGTFAPDQRVAVASASKLVAG